MTAQLTGEHPGRAIGVMTIVLTLAGWASVPLFLRHFAHLVDPWTSNGWRYGFSALLWAPVLVAGLARRGLPAGLWRAAVVPSLINAVAQTLFCLAHYQVDPGLLTFGLRSNIVFATVGAAIFFPVERAIIRSPGYLPGLALVVGGTVGTVLLGPGLPSGATVTGVVLAVVSGALFASYALAVRHWMRGVGAIRSFAVISLYTALPLVGLMLLLGDRSGLAALDLVSVPVLANPQAVPGADHGAGPGLPGGQFTMLLISAVIGIALGHVFYYHSIRTLGVAVSAGVVQLQPFLVSAASMWLFGERLTATQWASGGVAIAGAVVILRVQSRVARRSAPTATDSRPG